MTTITLRTYKAESSNGFVAVSIMSGSPFPARQVEVRNTAEAAAELAKYKAEAEATGVSMVASIGLARGQRAPNGFKKLPVWTHINC